MFAVSCCQAYLAQHLLSLSEFPDKDNVCQQILAHAKDPNQPDDEAETVVGGDAKGKGKAAGFKGGEEPLRIIIAGAPCSGQTLKHASEAAGSLAAGRTTAFGVLR